jgi:hypothetical protein
MDRASLLLLLEDLAVIRPTHHQAQIAFTFAEARNLFDHGEEVVAFEILCSNLYEFDFPLTKALYERIASVGESWHVESRTWSRLESLAV